MQQKSNNTYGEPDTRNFQPVGPVAMVNAAVEIVRPSAETRNIRLQVMAETGTGTVNGDPDRLQQVAWNLLSNAASRF